MQRVLLRSILYLFTDRVALSHGYNAFRMHDQREPFLISELRPQFHQPFKFGVRTAILQRRCSAAGRIDWICHTILRIFESRWGY